MNREDSRAAIEAAFDQWEEENSEEETVDEVETEEEVDTEDSDETVDSETTEVIEDDESEELESVADDESESEEEPETTVSETVSAPNSWRAEAREVWAEVPEAARAEIEKREAEMQAKLGENSERVGLANRFEQAIEPFKQTIAIEAGGDPIEATRNLMGFATRLRGGTAHEKAVAVRDIIQQYGVDIDTLDSALAESGAPGASPPGSSPGPAPSVADPRVEQMWHQQQLAQQQQQNRVMQETQAFLDDPANEFANDVRKDMADLMSLSAQRGQEMTLKEAYDRAVQMRPDLQGILQNRQAAPPVKQNDQESLRRKKRASKSVKGAPSGDGGGAKAPTSRRGAIMASWDALERGA